MRKLTDFNPFNIIQIQKAKELYPSNDNTTLTFQVHSPLCMTHIVDKGSMDFVIDKENHSFYGNIDHYFS